METRPHGSAARQLGEMGQRHRIETWRLTMSKSIEQLGPYRLLRRLGKGGMGTVYAAERVDTGEAAAVKMLAPALCEEEGFRERFSGEIETLRMLKHRNIVRLYGFGYDQDVLFYAMELIEGSSLEEELRLGRRFDWREVTDVAVQVARALRHAHDRGITHRDLKPANLLMTSDGTVKLADFGIARLFGHTRLTQPGNVIGTAEYMAPEQAAGKPVGPRSDLYSLGAVMYALLAGHPVFRAESMAEAIEKHLREQPMSLRRRMIEVPDELDQIILQLLAKAPAERIGTAQLLGRRLEAMRHALGAAKSLDPDDRTPLIRQTLPGGSGAHRGQPAGDEKGAPEGEMEAESRHVASRGHTAEDEIPPTIVTRMPSGSSAPPLGDQEASAPPSAKSPPAEEPGGLGRSGPPSHMDATQDVPASRPASAEGHGVDEDHGVAEATGSGGTGAAGHGAGPPSRETTGGPEVPSAAAAPLDEDGRFTEVEPEEYDPLSDRERADNPIISMQTWILVAALLLIGFGIWYALQPPAADELYRAAAEAAERGGAANLSGVEDEIQEFLARYPDDRRVAEVRRWQREVELERLQRRFDLRVKGLADSRDLLPIERAYLDATLDQRLHPERSAAKIEALLALYGATPTSGEPFEAVPGPRAEILELARRRLEQLRQRVDREAERHQAVLAERLEVADQLAEGEPSEAREVYQAIIRLYGDKPWAAAAVERARGALERLPAEGEE